jgi:hypothetical protein
MDYEQKLATMPSGLVLYHPPGNKGVTPRRLGTEFLTEAIEAVLIVFLTAKARLATVGARLAFAAVVGLLAAIPTNVSYWNWYGFPRDYTIAYMVIQIVGFLCVGVVAGFVIKHEVSRAAGAA